MFIVKAPAKINWSLFVLDKREDGYHNIVSLLQCISLYDTLEFEPADEITLESAFDLPYQENLVYKAAMLLRGYSRTQKGARIVLKKEIPSGAGLGGGSSDAAFTLMGLNSLWGLGLQKSDLKSIANKLGSDVPFFLEGPFALAEGRGEKLTSLPLPKSQALLIVKAGCSVPTSWAYAALGRESGIFSKSLLAKADQSIQAVYRAVSAGDLPGIARSAYNDFERAVIDHYPVVGNIKNKLLERGAVLALMSGSGSAVFGLFENEGSALSASKYFPSFFCRVVKTFTDPVL